MAYLYLYKHNEDCDDANIQEEVTTNPTSNYIE